MCRVAVVAFSTSSSVVFDFNDYSTVGEMKLAITELPFIGGSTYVSPVLTAVNLLRQESRGFRGGKMAVIFAINDAALDDPADMEVAADALRQQNVDILAFGVGDQISMPQLHSVVSSPVQEHAFFHLDFNEVSRASVVDRVLDTVCIAPILTFMLPTTTPAPTTAMPLPCASIDFIFILDAASTFTVSEWTKLRGVLIGMVDILPPDSRYD
jgi:hypothetical protein